MSFDPAYALQATLVLTSQIAVPVIVAASVAGVVFAVVQAVTQIGDQSLSTGAKFGAAVLVIVLIGQGFGAQLVRYGISSFNLLAELK